MAIRTACALASLSGECEKCKYGAECNTGTEKHPADAPCEVIQERIKNGRVIPMNKTDKEPKNE